MILLRFKVSQKLAVASFSLLVLLLFTSYRLLIRVIPSRPSSYKAFPTASPPITENFPQAESANIASDLPPVPSYNQQWHALGNQPAPLMIGFTRNWLILQQCVVSYLTAGWPASSIYVIDNTGTMNSNRLGRLSLQNPFYLNHHRLTKVFGVNVLVTPSLQNFAQLQNFMMSTAMERGWETYFWSHMDVAVLSDETFTVPEDMDQTEERYSNLFDRAIRRREQLISHEATGEYKWAAHWFAYDRLTLVNLKAYMDIGGWDSMIDYYLSDCDFHERLFMDGYVIEETHIGLVANIAHTVPDLGVFFRRRGWTQAGGKVNSSFGEESPRGDQAYHELRDALVALDRRKSDDSPDGANAWQRTQQGGQDEPFHKDAQGFDTGLWLHVELGRKIFAEKWGYRYCNLREQGLKSTDAWRVKKNEWWKLKFS